MWFAWVDFMFGVICNSFVILVFIISLVIVTISLYDGLDMDCWLTIGVEL